MKPSIILNSIRPRLEKIIKLEARHAAFAATLVVLAVYLLIVWRISSLAAAEPNATQQTAAQTSSSLPKVDAEAIKQIQELEHRNSQIKSLFSGARSNPFQE